MTWDEFQDQLMNEFPLLHSSKPRCISGVSEGWFKIIHDASKKIEDLITSPDDVMVSQIKEKFAGLRFYVVVKRGHPNEWIIKEVIRDVKSLSLKTCEICGDPGSKERPHNTNRIQTLCKRHYEEWKS